MMSAKMVCDVIIDHGKCFIYISNCTKTSFMFLFSSLAIFNHICFINISVLHCAAEIPEQILILFYIKMFCRSMACFKKNSP